MGPGAIVAGRGCRIRTGFGVWLVALENLNARGYCSSSVLVFLARAALIAAS